MKRLLRIAIICFLAGCWFAASVEPAFAAGRFPLIERAVSRIRARTVPPPTDGQLKPQGDPLASQPPAARQEVPPYTPYRPLFRWRLPEAAPDSSGPQSQTAKRVPTLAPPQEPQQSLDRRVPTLAPPRQAAGRVPTLAPPRSIIAGKTAPKGAAPGVKQATSILVVPESHAKQPVRQAENEPSPDRAGGRGYSGPREF